MGDARIFFGIILVLLAIPLVITVGLFVLIPLALIWLSVAAIKYRNRPKPVSTVEIHQQAAAVIFPEPDAFQDNMVRTLFQPLRSPYPCWNILSLWGGMAYVLYEHEDLFVAP